MVLGVAVEEFAQAEASQAKGQAVLVDGACDMTEPIWACTLCGYCDAICPSLVHNVEIENCLAFSIGPRKLDSATPLCDRRAVK